jgi:hypothetical protein
VNIIPEEELKIIENCIKIEKKENKIYSPIQCYRSAIHLNKKNFTQKMVRQNLETLLNSNLNLIKGKTKVKLNAKKFSKPFVICLKAGLFEFIGFAKDNKTRIYRLKG